jgi:hypothetical protein
MRLNKDHLNQPENIQPPMMHALTLPIQTDDKLPRDTGIIVYVCASTFGPFQRNREDVLAVAKELMLSSEMPSLSVAESAILLLEQTIATRPDYFAKGMGDYKQAWKIIEAWRGKGDDSKDLLDALEEAKAALVGDSNDAEHDALVSFVKAMGLEIPDCTCDEGPTARGHHDANCPSKEWEGK